MPHSWLRLATFLPVCFGLLFANTPSAAMGSESTERIEQLPLPKADSPNKITVSAILKKRTAEIIVEARKCKRTESHDGMTSSATVLLDTASIFSITVSGSAECEGMPHMEDWEYGLVYDMKKGKRYNPLTLYRIMDGTNKSGRGTLKPELANLIIKQETPLDDQGCMNQIVKIVHNGNFSSALALDGVHLYFVVDHFTSATCFSEATLSYQQIGQYLDRAEALRMEWVIPVLKQKIN